VNEYFFTAEAFYIFTGVIFLFFAKDKVSRAIESKVVHNVPPDCFEFPMENLSPVYRIP
jgi:hypothetical protein